MKSKFKKPKDALEQCDPERVQVNPMATRIAQYLFEGNGLTATFVYAAVERYAEHVLAHEDLTRKAMLRSFINPDAWLICAAEWRKRVSKPLEAEIAAR